MGALPFPISATRGHRGRFVSAADNSGGARERAAARGRGIATPHRTAPHRTAPRWGRRGDTAETPPGPPRPPRNPRSPQPRHVPAPGHGHRRWHTRGEEVGVCTQVGAARGVGGGEDSTLREPPASGIPPVPRYPLALGIPPRAPGTFESSETPPAPWGGAQGAFCSWGRPQLLGMRSAGDSPTSRGLPRGPPGRGKPPTDGNPPAPGNGGRPGLALIGGEGAATPWGGCSEGTPLPGSVDCGQCCTFWPPRSLSHCASPNYGEGGVRIWAAAGGGGAGGANNEDATGVTAPG